MKQNEDKNRLKLIVYSIKAEGEYSKIAKMITDNQEVSDSELESAKKVQAITIFDKDYPLSFRTLDRPPFVVFYKGNRELLSKKCGVHAIIGSRIIDSSYKEYVEESTKKLCYYFNGKGDIVVSGLALGVDAIAHDYSQRSIGVIGCGIDYIYPLQNSPLYEKLKCAGLILSEYPGSTKPLSYHFPFRNRLVAALGDDTYVMCIKQKQSGTNITINNALELNKKIYVLPMPLGIKNHNNSLLINAGIYPLLNTDLGEEEIDSMMPKIKFK